MVAIDKSYGGRKVLEQVSLQVGHGEIVGLLGPNGAGKTVCFYSIVGLVQPDAGQILLNGTDITDLPTDERARLGLGYLPQEPSIFTGLTVEENIRTVLELYEPDSSARAGRLESLLDDFRIAHVRHLNSGRLSGGERRRCEIARALAASPAIMLLDEPFAHIDPLSILDLKALVEDLKRRDVGVLITDHNVHEMLTLVDRAYILYKGRLLDQGTPAELMSDSDVRHLYLGDTFEL